MVVVDRHGLQKDAAMPGKRRSLDNLLLTRTLARHASPSVFCQKPCAASYMETMYVTCVGLGDPNPRNNSDWSAQVLHLRP